MNIINTNVINKNNQLHIHLHFRSPPHLAIHLKKQVTDLL